MVSDNLLLLMALQGMAIRENYLTGLTILNSLIFVIKRKRQNFSYLVVSIVLNLNIIR